jgi:hypothetical protein
MAKKQNFAEEVPAELFDEEVTQPTALTHRTSNALVDLSASLDFNLEGARPPYLALVHGVGEAAANFNPGDLVLHKEYLVCPKGKKLDIVILKIEQYLKQRVSNDDWQAGVRPSTFATKADAQAAGLRTDWENGMGPDVSPAMDMNILIRKPADVVCGLFGIDIGDDHEYAIARLSSDKTAYKYLFNDIALIIKTKLAKTGIFSASWEFYTELSKPNTKGNRTQVIRAKFKEMLEPSVTENIVNALGAPSNG